MTSSRQLSGPAFTRAAAFLRQARPLEQRLFAFHFERAAAETVRGALRKFQNDDGGFHSLEADIGFPASSVLSTCHALHLLHELDTPPTNPIVQRTLDYLLATYDGTRDVWPIIPPHDNSQPHAPWWHYAEESAQNWQGLRDNPRPDVLAGLQAYPTAKTRALVARVAQATLARLRETTGALEMYGLLCYLRLHRAPNLATELKTELERVLPRSITANVERDPTKWNGYGLRPLDVAPRSDSPWRPLVAGEVEANLDFLIQTQTADGSWHPHWNWGDSFPEAWPRAKLQWQAVLTLANLRILRSYGRLAAA
jgi:hypothetical protein